MNARFLIKPLAAAVMALPALASASSMVAQPGPLLTLGATPTPATGFTSIYNPAAGEMAIAKEDTVRWGYISSLGFQLEIGDFDDFDTQVDDLIDDLDQDDIGLLEAQQIIDDYEAIRGPLSEQGFIKTSTHLSVPITPFSIRLDSIKGVLTINSKASADIFGGFLDDSISFVDPDGDGNGTLESNSAVYIKGAESLHLGVSYSTELGSHFKSAMEKVPGKLFGGVTLNYYNISLSKQTIALTSTDEDEELSDIIDDSYEDNQKTTSNVGLDLGLIWQKDNYTAGFAWRNINEPEFDYGEIGTNCGTDDNCGTAFFFRDRIDLSETYVMNSQASISGSFMTEDHIWQVSASMDLNEARDPIGDEFQWLSISGNYKPASWTSFRVGYASNLAGSELDTLNAGLSLGPVNLDVRYGLDSISLDGSDIPRTIGFNIGIESQF